MTDLYSCDVLLYRGTALISRMIRLLDGTKVNHAGVYLSEEGEVAEALFSGLTARDLDTSISNAEQVWSHRLIDIPADMSPVYRRARHYVDSDQRYAFEQILLLAALCLTRKARITPSLKLLLRKALDTAASVLAGLTEAGKQPMICSEFVFRAYNEALSGVDDVYTIELLTGRRRPSGTSAVRTEGESLEAGGSGIRRGSLLSQYPGPGSTGYQEETRRRSDIVDEPAPVDLSLGVEVAEKVSLRGLPEASTPELDDLIEAYLNEVRALPTPGAVTRAPREEEAYIADQRAAIAWELRNSVESFAASLYEASEPGAMPTRTEAPESRVESATRAADHLYRWVADFVTPGDLLNSPDLTLAGALK